MAKTKNDKYRDKWFEYRIYAIAFFLAVATTVLVAPEACDDNSMAPVLKEDQAVILTQNTYSQKRGLPDEGMIVVMEKAYSQDAGAEDNIIARICGQPGDTISAEGGKLYRNGEEYELAGSSACPGEFSCKVDQDSVFILYDNREMEGYDSRKIGPVPMTEIKGPAKMIVWPLSDFGRIKG